MKKALFILIVTSLILPGLTLTANAQQYTRSYYRANGTYIQGYYHAMPGAYHFTNPMKKSKFSAYTGNPGIILKPHRMQVNTLPAIPTMPTAPHFGIRGY